MQATSFLVGVFLVLGALESCHSAMMKSTPESDLLDTLNLENCNRLDVRERCITVPKAEYRTFDGTCNNLCNITNGAAGIPFSRIPGLDPPTAFAPGFKPRIDSAVSGKLLSLARTISTAVFASSDANVNNTAPNFTHVTMTWGQFLDHDLTLTQLVPDIECGVQEKPCEEIEGCTNIPIPAAVPLVNNQTVQCIPLRRANQNAEGEQLNIITSHMDGSQVYGSDKETAEELRDEEDPRFLATMPYPVSEVDRRCGLLPEAEEEAFCRSPNPMDKPCFRAGDERVNENQALMAMHTLWVREHNRIAAKLTELDKHLGAEEVYQLARKIVIAELQHITYNEWLPVLFSEEILERENLTLAPKGEFFDGYDPSVDPTIHNSFGAAVLRVGHTLIRSKFLLVTNSRVKRSKRRFALGKLDVDFFNPQKLYLGLKINFVDEILHGLVVELAQLIDKNFVEPIRESLIIEGPDINGTVGDLTAINIQRGRDHGLPPYVVFRELCGAGKAKFFPDLLTTTTQKNINNLKSVYLTVKDIDLFPGGITESPVEGSQMGFTYTCLMTKQFFNLRFGDRFWYERNNPETGFTIEQLDQIRHTSLARVYCDNNNSVFFIQGKAFRPKTGKSGDNPVVDCDFLPMVDLEPFVEKKEEPMKVEMPAETAV